MDFLLVIIEVATPILALFLLKGNNHPYPIGMTSFSPTKISSRINSRKRLSHSVVTGKNSYFRRSSYFRRYHRYEHYHYDLSGI